MHSVRIELAKLILVGTRITYQATGDVIEYIFVKIKKYQGLSSADAGGPGRGWTEAGSGPSIFDIWAAAHPCASNFNWWAFKV